MICKRCGEETSNALCSSCGYINDPDTYKDYDATKSKYSLDKKMKSSRLVRKWRWTRPLGYLNTISSVLYTIAFILSILAVVSFVIFFLITFFAREIPLPINIYAKATIRLTGAILFVGSSEFLVELIRIFSCMGLASYMRKNQINGKEYIDVKKQRKSDLFVRDALVIQNKPGWLGLFFPKALVDTQFNLAIISWLGATATVCMHFLYLERCLDNVDSAMKTILTIIIVLFISLLIGLHIFIPFAIYSRIMGSVLENKTYARI